MSKVCYCNDCLQARSEKKRLPFTCGDNIFITGTHLSFPHLSSPHLSSPHLSSPQARPTRNDHHIPASPYLSLADNLSDKSGTSKISHSISENIISNSQVSNRRSMPGNIASNRRSLSTPQALTPQALSPHTFSPRDRGVSSLRRSGSVRLPHRTLGSLSNVSVLEAGYRRSPPSYHSPSSYSSFIVIAVFSCSLSVNFNLFLNFLVKSDLLKSGQDVITFYPLFAPI